MIGLIPSGVLEFLLFAVLVGGFIGVVRALRRRRAFLPAGSAIPLPILETEVRVLATLRRIYRDPDQGIWLVEAAIGVRKFTFCLTDHEANQERYTALINKKADLALFALATLAPGGIEAMRDQIRDIDQVDERPDMVRLVPAGQLANDYAVIGRVLSSHEDTIDGDPVHVYRTQVVRQDDLTLVIDLATERQNNEAPAFANDTMVHGSARLFGALSDSP